MPPPPICGKRRQMAKMASLVKTPLLRFLMFEFFFDMFVWSFGSSFLIYLCGVLGLNNLFFFLPGYSPQTLEGSERRIERVDVSILLFL